MHFLCKLQLPQQDHSEEMMQFIEKLAKIGMDMKEYYDAYHTNNTERFCEQTCFLSPVNLRANIVFPTSGHGHDTICTLGFFTYYKFNTIYSNY